MDQGALLRGADLLARFRPLRLFSQQAVGQLVAVQFAYHDMVDLVVPPRETGASPRLRTAALINLASGRLRLGSLYGRKQVSGDTSRKLAQLMRDGFNPAKLKLPRNDILRLHNLVGGVGASLSFDELEQLPPHIRGLYFDERGLRLNRAIIPDLRNDQSLLLSQFHRALLAQHNAEVDRITSASVSGREPSKNFRHARSYLVDTLHEFLRSEVLPEICTAQSLALLDRCDLSAMAPATAPLSVALEAVVVFETLLLLSQFARVHPQPGSNHAVFSGACVSVLPGIARRGLADALFSTPRWPQSLAAANRVAWPRFPRGRDQEVITMAQTGFGGDDPDLRSRQSFTLLELVNLCEVASGQAMARWCSKAFEIEVPVVHHGDVLCALGAEEDTAGWGRQTPLPLYVALEGELIGTQGRLGPMASLLLVDALHLAIRSETPCKPWDLNTFLPDDVT